MNNEQPVASTENRAIENFKKKLAELNINIKGILED